MDRMTSADHSDTEYERIARQLAGEAGESERAEFHRWLEDPAVRALYEASARDWEVTGVQGSADVDGAWARMRARITAEPSTGASVRSLDEARKRQTNAPRLWWRDNGMLLRAAAIGFVLVGAGVLWSRFRSEDAASMAEAPSVSVLATTRVGERTQVDLPDGSVVRLGPASTLRTLDGYGGPSREVELTGEAAFRVTHDSARPFRVRTAGAVIEDLGTEFVVRALEREPVRVAVSEGSVGIRRAGASAQGQVVLRPRDVAVLTDTGEVLISRGVDVERYSAWTSGTLVFQNTALRDVIVDLERWYDVEFDVTDQALLGRSITVTLFGQPIDEVLQIIGPAVEMRFERQGKTIRVAAPVRTGLVPTPAVQVGDGA
jgi:ferric-dicitrate binding protein FerR (iron transport regulator)